MSLKRLDKGPKKRAYLVFVESEEDQGSIVVEVRVRKQRGEEVVDPVSEERVRGVVSYIKIESEKKGGE